MAKIIYNYGCPVFSKKLAAFCAIALCIKLRNKICFWKLAAFWWLFLKISLLMSSKKDSWMWFGDNWVVVFLKLYHFRDNFWLLFDLEFKTHLMSSFIQKKSKYEEDATKNLLSHFLLSNLIQFEVSNDELFWATRFLSF